MPRGQSSPLFTRKPVAQSLNQKRSARVRALQEKDKQERLSRPIIGDGGAKVWQDEEGFAHRDNGPAAIYPNGQEEYYKHGVLHREGGPAILGYNGDQVWYKNGKIHREDGPAFIAQNGKEEYLQNNQLHRVDGPAVIFPSGVLQWWENGKLIKEEVPEAI